MNEKIKAVSKEAGVWRQHYDIGEESPAKLEEFAKLLIKEFAYDCMDTTGKPEMVEFAAKYWGVSL